MLAAGVTLCPSQAKVDIPRVLIESATHPKELSTSVAAPLPLIEVNSPLVHRKTALGGEFLFADLALGLVPSLAEMYCFHVHPELLF